MILSKNDLLSMDYAYMGEPYVNVVSDTGIKTYGLDYFNNDSPFISPETPYIQKIIFIV